MPTETDAMPNPTEPTAPTEQTEQGRIDVILLAAGQSRRFGRENKLLAPFRGRTLVRRALELACSLPLEGGRVIFVYSAPEVRGEAGGLPVHAVHNPSPELGRAGSVRLAVAASSAGYYLFMPADQPLLDAGTVRAVTALRGAGRIVVPVHEGRPGSPALFSASFREELLALPDGTAPGEVKKRHADCVVTVEIQSPLALADVDTPADLLRLEREGGHA